eukprot:Sspe_Gene.54320::Locus_29987_Transcript_1_1_Confidence_1.000_Length_1824::g.54320::m.54320/K00278/nadB; L-aspartate oxidase
MARPVLQTARAVRQTAAKTLLIPSENVQPTDVLVLGCGIAGSTVALRAARAGLKVTMLTAANDPHDCNSYWAQGGIIYRAQDDTPDLLARDVHAAGAGLCRDAAVSKLAEDGPRRVEQILIDEAQVPFDRDERNDLALCLEASHNRARIIHYKDQTGAAITQSMLHTATAHDSVRLVPGATAVDLLTSGDRCIGAVVIDNESGEATAISARATVLATGGLGEIYEHTSNPDIARGDGFAMAARAGAQLQNMEFVQFHPTTLYLPGERRFLLSEALRGVGAKLVDKHGVPFAHKYHADAELAPRDVVSRMITEEMRKQDEPCMYLDLSRAGLSPEYLYERFPAIREHCQARGFDIARDPLPVVPAAHYFCGGVATDLEGRTSLLGLYAAGEVACTGLHGANRLASTSLLEGLVWGAAIADHLSFSPNRLLATEKTMELASLAYSTFDSRRALPLAAVNEVDTLWKQIKETMWSHVGVERSPVALREAVHILGKIKVQANDLFLSTRLAAPALGVRNASEVALLIAQAAVANPESVGTHYVRAGAA